MNKAKPRQSLSREKDLRSSPPPKSLHYNQTPKKEWETSERQCLYYTERERERQTDRPINRNRNWGFYTS